MKLRLAMLSCTIGAVVTAACQQGPGQAGNAQGEAPGNAANAQASAPPSAPDPADQTGPVALASDAGLPEPCRTVVRETQACIDNLSGAQAGFREGWVRTSLASSRRTWASAQDDSYRGPVCEQDLRTLRQRAADWGCAAR
jgi:hypothetical protein